MYLEQGLKESRIARYKRSPRFGMKRQGVGRILEAELVGLRNLSTHDVWVFESSLERFGGELA